MKIFRKNIPIKKYRSDLRDDKRIKVLQFKRNMSPLQVRNLIRRNFNFLRFNILRQFQTLSVAQNQAIDGAAGTLKYQGCMFMDVHNVIFN